MPPLPLKNPPRSSQTQTLTLASPHLRDAMRAATVPSHPPPPSDQIPAPAEVRFGPRVELFAAAEAKKPRILCYEEIDGRKWSYVVEEEEEGEGEPRRRKKKKKGGVGSSLRAVSMQTPMAPAEVVAFR